MNDVMSSRLVADGEAAADMVQLVRMPDNDFPPPLASRADRKPSYTKQEQTVAPTPDPVSVDAGAALEAVEDEPIIHNGLKSTIPWSAIFWFLGDSPESIETLRDVCQMFRLICSEPSFRAAFIIKRACKHLAFNHVYTTRPWDLTFDLADALLSQGALLPKFFVERMYDAEQKRAADERDGWQRIRQPVPPGTLEYLIAQGYKLYGDGLFLNLPSEAALAVSSVLERISVSSSSRESLDRQPGAFGSDGKAGPNVKDDSWLFDKALSSALPNMKVLKRILYEHHYTPALNPPATVKGWDDLWGKVLNLLRTDAEVGKFVYQHAACSGSEANDGLMARALRDPRTKDNFLKWLTVNGYKITEGAVVQVLASPDVLQLDSIAGMSALDLLRSSVPESLLSFYAESALAALFRDGGREALRAADTILLEFELPEEAITRAFLVSPDELAAAPTYDSSLEPPLPFMTALGRARGGMTDMMWQLILARHGSKHPFASACLVDLVIGGTLKNPLSARHRQGEVLTKTDAGNGDGEGGTGGLDGGFVLDRRSMSMDADDDRDRDSATRDSIEAMVEGAGVLIEPSLFGPISRSVLGSKKARARVLDFMTRVEKGLLFAAFDPAATSIDRQRWSKVRWVAALRRHVLDDRQWLQQMVSPEELTAIDERRRRERGPPKRGSGIFSTNGQSTTGPTSPETAGSFGFKTLAAAGVGGFAGFGKTLGGMVRTRARGVAAAAAAAAAANSGMGGSRGMSAFLGSMVVDLVDREWAEVRRFYTCCELLVNTLETSPSTGGDAAVVSGYYGGRVAPPPPPVPSHASSSTGYAAAFLGPEQGPFTRWLRDLDTQQRAATAQAAAVAAQAGKGTPWWMNPAPPVPQAGLEAPVTSRPGGRWF
ncbi:hypothetical protein HDU67_005380 [Dinochytrium kinnereticum]|nr:hypothetical protein HDU67_005380 [Dinochytrium kinnereticum]